VYEDIEEHPKYRMVWTTRVQYTMFTFSLLLQSDLGVQSLRKLVCWLAKKGLSCPRVFCDTSSVTVVTKIFLQYLYSVINNVTWFKFEFKFKSFLLIIIKPSPNCHL
jgi:hypothetical protein